MAQEGGLRNGKLEAERVFQQYKVCVLFLDLESMFRRLNYSPEHVVEFPLEVI